MLSFANAGRGQALVRVGILVGALAVLLLLARSRVVDRWLSRTIARLLNRWTDLEARDYAQLLHLSGDYAVDELAVREGDWLAGDTLVVYGRQSHLCELDRRPRGDEGDRAHAAAVSEQRAGALTY